MDRADKIMTALLLVALIAVLLWSHRPRGAAGAVRVNMSVAPSAQRGPAYLLSNLPLRRRADDFADAASYFVPEGKPDFPASWED